MTHRGRPPLGLEHVWQLEGSDHAKQRMAIFLRTLQSDCGVGEACQELELHESYFHALRHTWLQQALELLEPRPLGRPANPVNPAAERIEQLEQQVQDLQHELAIARVRCEVLGTLGQEYLEASTKKGAS